MTDVSQGFGGAIHNVTMEIGKACNLVSHLYTAAEEKLKAFEQNEPSEMASLKELLRTGESFLAAAVPAITEKGISLPADSAAFAALEAFIESFEGAASAFRASIAPAEAAPARQ